jgi:arylsulfatase A-like enzyme
MKKLNLVLLTIDALRPDHLTTYGYHRPTNEAISPFEKNMVVFRNAYTYSFPTVRAFPALLASTWPDACSNETAWQYFKKTRLPKWSQTLSETLKQNGYHCTSHTGWSNFLTSGQGYARGVDDFVGMLRQDGVSAKNGIDQITSAMWRRFIYSFRYFPSMNFVNFLDWFAHWMRESLNIIFKAEVKEVGGVSGRSSEVVTQYLNERIKTHQYEPFFVWGHYHDAHVPLYPSPEHAFTDKVTSRDHREIGTAIYRQTPLNAERHQKLIDLYDGGIRSAFYQIRRVFDQLKTLNLLDKTCVAISSDHGCALWDHQYWSYPEHYFYNESIKVPLLIHHPQVTQGPKMIDTPVSHLDLTPSLVELCGNLKDERSFGSSFAPFLIGKNPLISREEVWLETLGPPRYTCLIKDEEKIVFCNSTKTFIGKHDGTDQLIPTTRSDEIKFLDLLAKYEKEKAKHVKQFQR